MFKKLATLLAIVCLVMSSMYTVSATEVIAKETGFTNILFTNGYRGFCIDAYLHGAETGFKYEEANGSEAYSNRDESNVSQYLKALFVVNFEEFFVSDGIGGYVLSDTNSVQKIIYGFTDAFYLETKLNNLAQKARDFNGVIPDTGYSFKISTNETIVMDFMVLKSNNKDLQDFFTYKFSVIPADAHTHEFNVGWKYDDKNHWYECTCGDKGEMLEHKGGRANCIEKAKCEDCGQPYGLINKNVHVGETEVRGYEEATAEKPGYSGDVYCKACSEMIKKGEVLPQLHKHEYNVGWKYDDKNHWYECTCGDKGETLKHKGGRANCTEKAKCEDCGQPYGLINKNVHVGDTEVRGYEEATTEKPGYSGDVYCKACSEMIKKGEVLPQLHKHEYNVGWKYDDKNHWYECACGDKGEILEHKGGKANCIEKAKCEDCGQSYGLIDKNVHVGETEVRGRIEPTKDQMGYSGDVYCMSCDEIIEYGEDIPYSHEHDFIKVWKRDAKNHWYECECNEKSNIEEHTFEDGFCIKCEYAEETYNDSLSGSNTVTPPGTGDKTNLFTWIGLFIASLGVILLRNKK